MKILFECRVMHAPWSFATYNSMTLIFRYDAKKGQDQVKLGNPSQPQIFFGSTPLNVTW